MKVILKEKYRKLGTVGDVVEVKGGFARNFLIPNDICVQATKDNVADFETRKAELLKISEKKESEAKKIAAKIDGKIITATKQASDDGRLYGSVTTAELVEELNKNSDTEIDRKQITISTSIKFLGIYQVEVDLGEGVLANLFVNVSRSDAEAKEAADLYKKGKISLGPLTNAREEEKKQKAAEVQESFKAPEGEESADKSEETEAANDEAAAESEGKAEEEK